MGEHKCVSVDRHKQIRPYPAGFFDARLQRNEIVAIARKHGAHSRLCLDKSLEALRNQEGNDFFLDAPVAPGAGILAAMACVNDDGDQTIDL